MRHARWACVIAATIVAGTPVAAQADDRAGHGGRTWYVLAGASEDGRGTRTAPFDELSDVEAASRPRDRIVVLPAPRGTPPLDGGIRLKKGQRLLGGSTKFASAAPRLTNTTDRLDGDAVRLASGVTVRNLEISGSRRGGIYGMDARDVTIIGNDVSGHNTSCTPGFHIPPFWIPTTVPGVQFPISDGLHNGWAGIMVDQHTGTSKVGIRGNRVHDADCGDGIDVRVSGTARVRAAIKGNDVSALRQGPDFESVLAIGMQSSESGRLDARLADNRQSGLGNDEDAGVGPAGADSEGLFFNPVGPSTMRVDVTRNSYTHTPGRGGFSANGLEFVSMGDGADAEVAVSDSTFSGTPGDVLEQLSLGTNSRLRMRLDRVVATGSTGFAGSGFGDTLIIPGNNADCLIAASAGAGNTVELTVRDSELTDCANNGLTFGSAVANGSGPTSALRLDVARTTITGNHDGNLRIGNRDEMDLLEVKVEDTNLSDSRGLGSTVANLTVQELGSTGHSVIDLGGGALGSRGGNCLAGGALTAEVLRYDVAARDNWWGQPGGAGPGRAIVVGGTLDDAEALDSAPAGC